MANTFSVDQVSSILRTVLSQATGQSDLDALDTKSLLTIGQRALNVDYDPVMSAISMVLSRTIFSNRPYERKFGGIRVAPERWGNYVRKLTILESDNDLENNQYIPLTDGVAVDQYTVRKPNTMQLNFVGQQTYQLAKTIFQNQLDTAFTSEEEFGNFISMLMTYCNNKIAKTEEEIARQTVAGFIAGKLAGDTSNVIHLVTEYRAASGIEAITADNVYSPEYFDAFIKWVYARINTISNLMSEYSIKYHTNLEQGVVMRHTPKSLQKLYMYAPLLTETTSRVLADTYHDNLLTLGEVETVSYWQNIDEPDTINLAAPNYLAANGNIATAAAAVNQSRVMGVLFDTEAITYSPILERQTVTPFNAAGLYTNMFWHINFRSSMDFTENAVVFLLD